MKVGELFLLVKEPLITESELASLKHNSEKEKQVVLEIYRIAFENFLEKEFTNKFLTKKIREQMNRGYDYLGISLLNCDIMRNRTSFNFKYMIGETFSNLFWWFFFNRVVIKRKFWKYRKEVQSIVGLFRENEIIQLSMEEIVEEVIYKSEVFLKIIDDLEKSGLRMSVKVDGEIFILLLTWGKWIETDNEENNENLILGQSTNGKSNAASEQRILKDLEKQREQGYSIHPLYVDPTNGDKENEEK